MKYQELSNVSGSQNKSNEAEELRTLKEAYEKMMHVKDQEIKEAEERLEEMMATQITTTQLRQEVWSLSLFSDMALIIFNGFYRLKNSVYSPLSYSTRKK
jgi:hypothetical protein